MKKSKIIINSSILDKIVNSVILSEKEKLNFMKYLAYMTSSEQKQLASLI